MRAESNNIAIQVKIMPTSTSHTPFPKLSVISRVESCLSLCLATMTRATSVANTMVDTIAVATDNTREIIQGAAWYTQHEAMTGRSVRNARPAAIGWSTRSTVTPLRTRFARSCSFVTVLMNTGSIVYPNWGPMHRPVLVSSVGLFSALE